MSFTACPALCRAQESEFFDQTPISTMLSLLSSPGYLRPSASLRHEHEQRRAVGGGLPVPSPSAHANHRHEPRSPMRSHADRHRRSHGRFHTGQTNPVRYVLYTAIPIPHLFPSTSALLLPASRQRSSKSHLPPPKLHFCFPPPHRWSHCA